MVHTSALVRFAQAKFIAPIDDLVSGTNGFDINDVDANVWQGAAVDGKHYALPLDVHILGMYYNKRMFREAGVVDAKGEARPPTNRDEFLDACARLTRRASAPLLMVPTARSSGDLCSPIWTATCTISCGNGTDRSSRPTSRAACWMIRAMWTR